MSVPTLDDGLLVVVKHECQTCVEIVPALEQLAGARDLTIASQDDPDFPEGLNVLDDSDLSLSWELQTEVTPTLYSVQGGEAELLTMGWRRSDWRDLTGLADLGEELPEHRPGCGSRIFEPGIHERLAAQHADRATARVETGRAGQPRRRARSDVRPRMVRRVASRPAHAGPGGGHGGRHLARRQ